MSETRTDRSTPDLQTAQRVKKRRWAWRLAVGVICRALLSGAYFWWNRREPQAPTEIFTGVTYGCERLETTEEGSGLVHWVRVDLTAPGVELFVTPLDASAQGAGWQYRLRRTGEVLASEHLAVVINGCLFKSDSGWLRMAGDFANGVETVVADHQVSHLWEHTYLLWFDDQLIPYLKPSKPPTAVELALAKWGIGGQAVGLMNGKVWPPAITRDPDSRTAVAIDQDRKLLFLAVAEYASPRLLLLTLGNLGAKDGMLLDGGSSSSMVIGSEAQGVRPGTLLGGWRPVATHFGVRARRLPAGR